MTLTDEEIQGLRRWSGREGDFWHARAVDRALEELIVTRRDLAEARRVQMNVVQALRHGSVSRDLSATIRRSVLDPEHRSQPEDGTIPDLYVAIRALVALADSAAGEGDSDEA